MKILFDYQAFANQVAGGVSRYFVELIGELGCIEGVEPTLCAPFSVNVHLRQAGGGGGKWAGVHLPPRWKSNPAMCFVDQLYFRLLFGMQAWDVYHPTYYKMMKRSVRARAHVVTVFDMTHERFPEMFDQADPTCRRKRMMVRDADGIICISEATRRDLIRWSGVEESRTTVIPLASRIGQVVATPANRSGPYWLFVGGRDGYKDFRMLLEVLQANKALASFDLLCFGGGAVTEAEGALLHRYGLTSRVQFIAGDDSVLRGAYEGAVALIYPSRHEGFGLPPLEAMTVGCPVIAANASSLPEVVGEAALLIPPGDAEALAKAMERIMNAQEYLSALVTKGRERASTFSWQRTACDTVQFYKKVTG